MSDKEVKFTDTNPENQKPHNISGNNPRSIQTLHKHTIKPKSQNKDIEIEIVENQESVYKTKTTYLVQKAKMQLKRRVAPGVSEIIIRKNEEKRKLAEEKAKKEAEETKQQEAESELQEKVEKEIQKQDEKIAQRKETTEEPAEETVEETVEEPVKTTVKATVEVTVEAKQEPAKETQSEATDSGKSFTQTLREQGLIQGQKIAETIEKAKPEVEAAIQETKTKVESKIEETKTKVEEVIAEAKAKQAPETKEQPKEKESAADGLSFTQYLRQQGLIQGTTTQPETTETPVKEEVVETKTEPVKEKVAEPVSEIKEEPAADGLSFTQYLRQQGLIQGTTTQPETTETPVKEETAEEPVEEEVVETKTEPAAEKVVEETKEDNSSDGEVKTFIDLIRSEGLL